jgi:type II secretory pathway component PulF
MREVDGYFPELAISVVHAGERGGRLEESFSRLANHYSNLVTFRNRLLASLAWPLFELSFAILIVGGLMALCDFIFVQIGKDPINWLWMGSTTGNVIAYFVLVACLIGGAFLFARGVARGTFGETPMRIARQIPLIGNAIEQLALSRFAWAMSVAENAGMNPIEVAKLALNSTENHYYKQHQAKVCRMLSEGKSFYKTLKATQAFPDDLLNYVDNGETAGGLAESMDRASQEYQNRADLNLKWIGTIGFVLTLLFVALLVLVIVVFAMTQYLNMLQSFSV